MDNRNKPEDLKDIVADIDTPPTPEVEEEQPLPDTVDGEESPETETEEVETIVTEEKPVTPKKPQTLEDRYAASTQEAQTQFFRNQELTETINDAANTPEPTLEELKAYATESGVNYEDIDPFMQNMLKETLRNKKAMDKIKAISERDKQITAWTVQVQEFASNESLLAKYPTLAAHTQEFTDYCMKKTRRGMELTDLLSSFLFGLAESPTPARGELFNSRGTGGDTPAPKTGRTPEELINKRNRSQKDYMNTVKQAAKKGQSLLEVE